MKTTRVILLRSLIGLALILGACATEPEKSSSLNFAAAFGLGGHADTDMTFDEFFDEDHTVVVRFMPQHPRAYSGPILAENGAGTYFVGQHSQPRPPEGVPRPDSDERLILAIGSEARAYRVDLSEATWHHLAVVRSGNEVSLYFDGEHLTPGIQVNWNDTQLPADEATLRLARRTTGKTFMFDGGNRVPQFYGFVDDVAVFDRALTRSEINTLIAQQLRLDPSLISGGLGLIAAWTFDSATPSGGPLPPAFDRPISLRSPADDGVRYEGVGDLEPAQKVPASQTRNGEIDAKFLLPPFHQNTYHLPFAPGEAWDVLWGNSTLNTHYGFAAFTWDFVLASTSVNTLLENADPTTCDQPLTAVASGTMETVSDDNYTPIMKDQANVLGIEIGSDELFKYTHVRTGSAVDAGIQVGDQVMAGQLIGRVGTRETDNCHVHFGARSASEALTIPLAFSNYEASDDDGATWYHVDRGVPKHGQWVRNIGDNASPLIEITQPSDGATFWYGGVGAPFEAEASDVEDGPSCCGIGWYSDVDGFLGPGATNNLALSAGEHVITARAQDSDGAVGTDSITVTAENVPPEITIVVPAEGDELVRGTPVVLDAEVNDVNELLGNMCPSVIWTSSVGSDPSLQGCNPQATFSTNGPRTLTATVTDEHGLAASASVTVTVVDPPPTGPPIVTILQPQDGAGLQANTEYTLEGTATDPDGESPLVYEWTAIGHSGAEYSIGVGSTLSWTPSEDIPFSCGGGEYGLRLEVTDPDSEVGQDSIDVYVAYPPC